VSVQAQTRTPGFRQSSSDGKLKSSVSCHNSRRPELPSLICQRARVQPLRSRLAVHLLPSRVAHICKESKCGHPPHMLYLAYGAMEGTQVGSGNFDRARKLYERALKHFPESGAIYEQFGLLFMKVDPAKAAEIFRRGLEKSPAHKALHKHLGHALMATGVPKNYPLAHAQFLLAERHHVIDIAGVIDKNRARVHIGHPRGSTVLNFLEASGFDVAWVSGYSPLQSVDLLVTAKDAEYVEAYNEFRPCGTWDLATSCRLPAASCYREKRETRNQPKVPRRNAFARHEERGHGRGPSRSTRCARSGQAFGRSPSLRMTTRRGVRDQTQGMRRSRPSTALRTG